MRMTVQVTHFHINSFATGVKVNLRLDYSSMSCTESLWLNIYLLACLQLSRPLCFENRTRFFALFLGNMLRARKYRFALCFRVLSNQYVERSAYATFFKLNRENKRIEKAKVNSRCFHWFPAAMLESHGRTPTWRLHTKHYNFQWYPLPNNSSLEYHTSPKLWHVVYLLLFYDISISWLNLLNGKRFYYSFAW